MTARISLPIRLILAASHGAGTLFRVFEAVRDELLLAYVSPAQRDAITAVRYAHAAEYLPNGQVFEQGLFGWEKALLARLQLPSPARVLLAGAGGGRELRQLVARGDQVFAFEPVAELCAGWRGTSDGRAGVEIVQGAYQDLVRLAGNGDGPLAGLRGPFDLVWLGWGSFTHVTVATEQAAVLASVRSLAPAAPVIASFYLHPLVLKRDGGIARLRRALRRLLGHLGGRNETASVEYWDNVGFTYTYSEAELRALFHAAGYSVAAFEPDPYPHALLVPE